MTVDKFLISQSASLRDALMQIEANQHGIILTVNADAGVTGLATDGDIRRMLIDGASLADPISFCANPSFVWADSSTPREFLLKQLDSNIRVIPVLDEARKLVGIVSRDHLPVQSEEPIYARARSPVRISFGGGGSDITHFFAGEGGAVINTTISLYSHATLRKRDDAEVHIHSRDLCSSLQAPDLQHVLAQKGQFGLIQALMKAVHPDFGFELYLHVQARGF